MQKGSPREATSKTGEAGQTQVLILAGIVLFLVVAGGIFFLGRVTAPKPPASQRGEQPQNVITSSPQPSPLSTETSAKVENPTANWKEYQESTYNFLVKYPSDWIVSPFDYKKFPVASPDQPQAIVSFSNKISEGITLGDPERIEIGIVYIKPKISFADFLNQERKSAESGIPKVQEILEGDVIVSGIQSKRITYKYNDITNTSVYIPKDGALYIVSNSTLNNGRATEARKFLDQILSTFRFIP